MLYFGGANAVSQSARGAVSGSVRIPADNRHSRQHSTLLRTHNVNDALSQIIKGDLRDIESVTVIVERLQLNSRDRVGQRCQTAVSFCLQGRYIVIWHGEVGAATP